MITSEWHNLSEWLGEHTVTSSAPCRVDCGSGSDQRLWALLCRRWHPATTNIALELRTTVQLKSHTPGKILVEVQGLGEEEVSILKVPLTSDFGLIFAIVSHFGVHGVHLVINSKSPLRSGLGGSGAVSVATIGALSKAVSRLGKDQHDLSEIVLLAHNIEDSLCGNTGLQDQAAAAFGGVHMWEWRYGSRLDFVRHSLLSDPKILDEHIVLAYTGEPHPSSRRGSALLHSFKQSGNLETLNQISVQARNFAKAIQSGDYEQAGHALLAEFDLRSQLVPQVLHREDYVLVEIAREAGCGAKFTGRGKGGCIWAIGPKEPIRETRQGWKGVFGQRGTGHMLPATIAREGLQVVVT